LEAKHVLATKKAELMMSGAIIGKNAESRDAQLASATTGETAALLLAETEKRKAALDYECVRMDVEMLQDLLRLMRPEA
jgi:hypothetical protein